MSTWLIQERDAHVQNLKHVLHYVCSEAELCVQGNALHTQARQTRKTRPHDLSCSPWSHRQAHMCMWGKRLWSDTPSSMWATAPRVSGLHASRGPRSLTWRPNAAVGSALRPNWQTETRVTVGIPGVSRQMLRVKRVNFSVFPGFWQQVS